MSSDTQGDVKEFSVAESPAAPGGDGHLGGITSALRAFKAHKAHGSGAYRVGKAKTQSRALECVNSSIRDTSKGG